MQQVVSRRKVQQELDIQVLDSDQEQEGSQDSGDSDLEQELGSQVLQEISVVQVQVELQGIQVLQVLGSQEWQEISGGWGQQCQGSQVSCRAQAQLLAGAWSRAAWAEEQRRWRG